MSAQCYLSFIFRWSAAKANVGNFSLWVAVKNSISRNDLVWRRLASAFGMPHCRRVRTFDHPHVSIPHNDARSHNLWSTFSSSFSRGVFARPPTEQFSDELGWCLSARKRYAHPNPTGRIGEHSTTSQNAFYSHVLWHIAYVGSNVWTLLFSGHAESFRTNTMNRLAFHRILNVFKPLVFGSKSQGREMSTFAQIKTLKKLNGIFCWAWKYSKPQGLSGRKLFDIWFLSDIIKIRPDTSVSPANGVPRNVSSLGEESEKSNSCKVRYTD